MPYIKRQDRVKLDRHIKALAEALCLGETKYSFAGKLNYCITRLTVLTLSTLFEKLNYQGFATVKGIFTDIADEFSRRLQNRYEDSKRNENGEVFGELL